MIPDKLVAALEQMDEKATKGPWRYEIGDQTNVLIRGPRWLAMDAAMEHVNWSGMDDDNALVLVALRNALPALVAYVQAADALRDDHAYWLGKPASRAADLDAARARLLAAITKGEAGS